MDRYLIVAVAIAMVGWPVVAAAKDDIPANVTTRPYSGNKAVDKIDWSFPVSQKVAFSKLKRCAIANVTNDEIQLKDSAGSWVGPATGNYYQNGHSSTIQGRDVFKVVDDKEEFLIAQGSIQKPVFAMNWIIRFDIELSSGADKVTMLMRNVQLAQSNTGAATNDGFAPMGTWYRFKQNYTTMEEVATRLKQCILE